MNAKYQGYSFPLRDTIQREKVRFHNRYGIELVGDLYLPMAISGKLAAVVKENLHRISLVGKCRSMG